MYGNVFVMFSCSEMTMYYSLRSRARLSSIRYRSEVWAQSSSGLLANEGTGLGWRWIIIYKALDEGGGDPGLDPGWGRWMGDPG